jgi:hypothetical protein
VLSSLFLPVVCRLSFLCLVPSFNCTWHLDPSPSVLSRATRQLIFIVEFQPDPIHQSFPPFSIQSPQLCSSSFHNIDNLIWPQPMCSKLPWMLHELVVIYQYRISLLECFLLDVSVVVGLFSFLLNPLIESCNKSVFPEFDQLHKPLLNNASVIHICKGCNS